MLRHAQHERKNLHIISTASPFVLRLSKDERRFFSRIIYSSLTLRGSHRLNNRSKPLSHKAPRNPCRRPSYPEGLHAVLEEPSGGRAELNLKVAFPFFSPKSNPCDSARYARLESTTPNCPFPVVQIVPEN